MDLVHDYKKMEKDIPQAQLQGYEFNGILDIVQKAFVTFLIIAVAVPITIAIFLVDAVEEVGIAVAIIVPLIGIGILIFDMVNSKNQPQTTPDPPIDTRTIQQVWKEGFVWQAVLAVLGLLFIIISRQVEWESGSMEFFGFLGGNFLGRIVGQQLNRTVLWAIDHNIGGRALRYVEIIFVLGSYLVGLTIDVADEEVAAGFGFANGLLMGIAMEVFSRF